MTADVIRALGVLAEPPGPATDAVARAVLGQPAPEASAYTELFLFHLYPYASVYTGLDGMLGGEARDRVAGFWRALDLTPPTEPDHLAALLGLYAALVERAEAEHADPRARDAGRRARAALLWEHLLSWLPPYLARVEDIAPPFYARWARVLGEVLACDADRLPAPADAPLHLREAPPPVAPDATLEAVLESLVAPARSGVILTRYDLGRAARDLGLGLRAGERAFMVRGLAGQDPDGVTRWLLDAVRRQAGRQGDRTPLPFVTAFWTDRARHTATLLHRHLEARQPSHA